MLQKGFRVLATNWEYKKKELDLVATDGSWLIIVEVKTRVEDYLVDPLAAITRAKKRNICLAGDAFARLHHYDLPVRYDVVSVVYRPASNTYEVEHIENAFYPEQNRPHRKRFY